MTKKPPRCPDIKRDVRRTLMQKGIDLCKGNITDFLQDALIIAKEKRLCHAVISAEFALEEFGKLLLLRDSMNNVVTDVISIDGKEFCNHDAKAERALTFLDKEKKYRVLFYEGMWQRETWAPGMWPEEIIEISSATRLACAFVDYVNNDWILGTKIDEDLFQEFVAHFKQKLAEV